MPEPYEELPIDSRERIVRALLEWAERQPRKRKPVLRYIDGSTLRAQDLLEESPRPFLLPEKEDRSRSVEGESRHWAHMLNLVAVSLTHGEDLNEILGDLQSEAYT